MAVAGRLLAISSNDVGLRPLPGGCRHPEPFHSNRDPNLQRCVLSRLPGIVARKRDILECPVEQPGQLLS